MGNEEFDKIKLVEYWLESANDDYETMIAMFDSKKYNWSLFVGHLMIEKYLKAYYVSKNEDFPPFTHNLLQLALTSKLILSEDQKKFLSTVTAFNINARYDDYKMSFHQKCTPEYTSYWIEHIKDFKTWIMKLIK
jgi:HEPN domain-containing protein